MGSVRFEGVRFLAYPQDHEPAHVHGFYAETELIVDIRIEARSVTIARRKDALRPPSAHRSDVAHILQVAANHFDALVELWRRAHA